MLQFHDRTRRRLLLAAFGLLCVTPTVLVAGWCAWRNRPGHAADEAGRLGRLLGFRVSLEAFEHVRPDVVRYHGLQLADVETGEPVLQCPMLQVSREQRASRPLLKLQADAAALGPGAVGRFEPLLGRLLRDGAGGGVPDAQLATGRVALDAHGRTFTLTNVDTDLATLEGGSQLRAAFHIDGADTPEPVQFRIGRNRQTLPPSTGFELDTGGGPVPCRLLGAALGLFAFMPQEATFSGRLWAQQAESGWQGETTGYLLDVDLEELTAGRLPHHVTGSAQLTLQSVRFQNNRLSEATGILAAGPGEIGRGLLVSAARELGMQSAPLVEADETVAYDQLALAFLLNADGLQLYGRIPTARGVVLAGRDRWLLAEAPSTAQPRSIPAVVRALSAPSGHHVPATPEAERLARWLPAPKPAPPPAAATSVYLREAHGGAAARH